MLELEGCEATFHATISSMHLTALKDVRSLSTFKLGPKDTNTLGKAIFLGRVGLDNHPVALSRGFSTPIPLVPHHR